MSCSSSSPLASGTLSKSGIIYTYGNCQLKSIAMYLKNIPDVKERYPLIEYFYVLNDVAQLDKVKLAQTEIFIYQHTTAKTMQGGKSENERVQATSEYITQHLLPKDCLLISIPSVYSSIYFPNVMTTTEAHAGFPASVPAEVFPNYTVNRRMHGLLLNRVDAKNIADQMCDENAYSKIDLERNEQQNYNNLRKREIDNQVTIPLADYIRANLRKKRLLLTTNHPSCYFFDYLLNEILKLMNQAPSTIALDMEDPMLKLGKAPLLPCVIKHLQLDMTHPSFANQEIWVNNHCCQTMVEYVEYLGTLLTGEY